MNYEEIREKYNLSLILMHGSQVTGKIHPKSDFDIAIFQANEQKYDMLGLILDLKILLKTERIDLTDISHADPLLLFSVINKCKLLAGDIKDFKSLERISFFKYSDYIPYLKAESDFVTKKINNYVKN